MKRLVITLAFSLGVSYFYGQDTLRLIWQANGGEQKSFRMASYSLYDEFIINWGDGLIDTTGKYPLDFVRRHTYGDTNTYTVNIIGNDFFHRCTSFGCSNMQISSLDVSSCTALEDLNCSSNLLTSLDVSSCGRLIQLYCENNQLTDLNGINSRRLEVVNCSGNNLTSLNVSNNKILRYLLCSDNALTSLDISGCTALKDLDCSNNRLLLSDLHIASSHIYSVCKDKFPFFISSFSCYLGRQELFPRTIIAGGTVDFSAQREFDGKSTVFVIKKDSMFADSIKDYYSITNGLITFCTSGNYTITMTNAAVHSYRCDEMPHPPDSFPPTEVIAEFTVIESGSRILSNLNVSEGTLTPAFNCIVTDYVVDVGYSVSSIIITATATDSNAIISGDTGLQQLDTGANFFWIALTAIDGLQSPYYIVRINRADTIFDNVIRIEQEVSKIKIYPNPTTKQLKITNYELRTASYCIYSVIGQLIMQGQLQDETTTINVESLTNGMYYLKIGNKVIKFIKY